MIAQAGQTWFIAGALPLVFAGALHALLTLVDVVRPTYFAPINADVKAVVEGTGIRFRQLFPGGGDRAAPTMWRAWLGFNISHGLGIFLFGLMCLLIAAEDFALVERIDALRPLAIAVSATYLLLALRFWFYAPAILMATSTACFTIAAVVSA